MIFCFDVDGTITANPDAFKEIMRGLRLAGHTVYALTGTIRGSDPDPEGSRVRQLSGYGLERGTHFDDIVIACGNDWFDCGEIKGHFCRDKNVAFMVEDSRPFVDSINRYSPETLVLRMPTCA